MARSKYSQWYADRRWRRLRALFLAENPLCVVCQERGILTPAVICDHVEPHKGDREKFWAGPFQALCKYHHDVKTIMEDGGLNSGAAMHPDWLPAPACEVVLVTGPPGGGKTTYCAHEARRGDVVIDLDECFREVCGVHGHTADRKYLKPAVRLRNKMLADLASKTRGRAFVIVSAPTQEECEWWGQKLSARHVRIDPGEDVCLERVDRSRRHVVMRWYERSRRPWNRSLGRGSDAEGNPTDPDHHWNRGEGWDESHSHP